MRDSIGIAERLRKLKKGKAVNPERAAAFKVAFDEFRKEAVRRKAEVKRGESRLSDFADWLTLKQGEADAPMGVSCPQN